VESLERDLQAARKEAASSERARKQLEVEQRAKDIKYTNCIPEAFSALYPTPQLLHFPL
jgi:hypothetical protein